MHAECTSENGHARIFELLADAVQEHLHTQVDADTVRQIVDERISHATLPRPIEVHLPDGTTTKLDDQPHRGARRALRVSRTRRMTCSNSGRKSCPSAPSSRRTWTTCTCARERSATCDCMARSGSSPAGIDAARHRGATSACHCQHNLRHAPPAAASLAQASSGSASHCLPDRFESRIGGMLVRCVHRGRHICNRLSGGGIPSAGQNARRIYR